MLTGGGGGVRWVVMGRSSPADEPWPRYGPKAGLEVWLDCLVGAPALPHTSCVTWGKLLTSLCLSFLSSEERIMGIYPV